MLPQNRWEKRLSPRRASKLSLLPHSPRTNQGSPKTTPFGVISQLLRRACQRPILGAALLGTPSRLSDSINRISRGITPLLPLRRDPRFNINGRLPPQECRLRLKRPSLGQHRGLPSL